MAVGTEGFYAVIIICLVVFLSLSACLGIRIIKRIKTKSEEEQLPSLRHSEWQPLRSVAVDVIDSQTLQAVSSNYNTFLSNVRKILIILQNTRMAIKIPSQYNTIYRCNKTTRSDRQRCFSVEIC